MLRSTLNASQIPECRTETCTQLSQSLSDYVDFNADPCTDFYQYACGAWMEQTTLPEDRVERSTFQDISEENAVTIQRLLEGSYEDLLEADLTGGQFTPAEAEREKDKTLFTTVQQFYRACMNVEPINKLGPSALYSQLARLDKVASDSHGEAATTRFMVQNKGGEEYRSAAVLTETRIDLLTALVIQGADQDIDPLITFDVVPNDAHPTDYAIIIGQPALTLGSKRLYTQLQTLDKFRDGLVEFVARILAPENQEWIDKANELDFKLLTNREEIADMIQRALMIETEIAAMSMEGEEITDPIRRHNPMATAELNSVYPIIDWERYLRHFIPGDTDIPETAIVYAPSYLTRLTSWLSENEISERALKDYFLLKLMFRWIAGLDTDTQKILQNIYGQVKSGNTQLRSRERICVARTNIAFGQLVGRYFVMKAFGGDDTRVQFDDLVTKIHDTWMHRVSAIEWLDESTRQEAISKLSTLRHFLGYNTVSPDIRSPSALNTYYSALSVGDDFYANEASVARFIRSRRWSKVGNPVDRHDWRIVFPYVTNAFQIRPLNAIVIPAGILQRPIYDPNSPASINYGTVGILIGHELTHAFDNSGRLFDSTGQLRQWWTNDTSNTFNEKAKCFIDQYSQFAVVGPDGESANVNGENTLAENLADNGGLAAAYSALLELWADDALSKDELNSYVRLPDSDLTPEQLFFIGVARTWCTKTRPQYAIHRVYTDGHSPPHVRVNAAMQNFPPFSEVFQCPAGSPMNPEKKCNIW